MTVNQSTFRLAVVFLGVALLTCIGGIVALTALHDQIPSVLDTTVGVVGGALAGLFVTPHGGSEDPTPVTVVPPPAKGRGSTGSVDGRSIVIVAVVVVAVLILLGVVR